MTVRWLDESGARRAGGKKWLGAPVGSIPAWVAEMDVAPPVAVSDALVAAVDRHATMYPPLEGDTDLVDLLADWHLRRLGQLVEAGSILFLGDVIAGVGFVLRTLLEAGDGVVVPVPAYPPFAIAVRHADRRFVPVPMTSDAGRYALDLDAIEAALATGARAVMLCNPHNPTGTAPTPGELRAVAELTAAHGALVISDEVHAPLGLPGATVTPFSVAAPDAHRRTVTITSVSKAFNLAGLRFAWLATHDEALARRLGDVPFYVRAGWSTPGVVAAAAAVGSADGWLDALVVDLAERHRRVADVLGPVLPAGAVTEPAASYLSWVDFAGTRVADDPAHHLRGVGVRVSPGPEFMADAAHARINVALALPLLDEALGRIADALA